MAQRTNTWFSSWPNIEWLTPQVKSTSISAQQVLADYLTDYGTDLPTRCTDGVWCKKILWVFTKRMKWQHKTAGRRIFKWSPQKDLLMFATRSLLLIAPIFTTDKKAILIFCTWCWNELIAPVFGKEHNFCKSPVKLSKPISTIWWLC